MIEIQTVENRGSAYSKIKLTIPLDFLCDMMYNDKQQ